MKNHIDRHVTKKVIGLSAALLFFLAVLFGLHIWEDGQGAPPAKDEGRGAEPIYYQGTYYMPREGLETTLLLGVDKYIVDEAGQETQGDFEQADFLLLLVTDTKKETCTAIHINRDTMAEIPILSHAGARIGSYTAQITLAHTFGGTAKIQCRNTLDAVSGLLGGVKIQHYVSLGMDGVVALNDLAGGVTLEVMDDFSGIDNSLVKGRTVTLRGAEALTYVRARKGIADGSNLHRMERQKQYIEALEAQLIHCADQDDDFIMTSLLDINSYMVSDCTIYELSDLAETLRSCGIAEYRTLEGEAVDNGQYIEYHADEEALQKMVLELFYVPSERP